MKTLNKIDLFLIDDTNKTKQLKILETFFKYPQPMNNLEAQLYLHNMFNEEFNKYISELKPNVDVRENISYWILKNCLAKNEDSQSNNLNWESHNLKKLKNIIEKFLHRN